MFLITLLFKFSLLLPFLPPHAPSSLPATQRPCPSPFWAFLPCPTPSVSVLPAPCLWPSVVLTILCRDNPIDSHEFNDYLHALGSAIYISSSYFSQCLKTLMPSCQPNASTWVCKIGLIFLLDSLQTRFFCIFHLSFYILFSHSRNHYLDFSLIHSMWGQPSTPPFPGAGPTTPLLLRLLLYRSFHG